MGMHTGSTYKYLHACRFTCMHKWTHNTNTCIHAQTLITLAYTPKHWYKHLHAPPNTDTNACIYIQTLIQPLARSHKHRYKQVMHILVTLFACMDIQMLAWTQQYSHLCAHTDTNTCTHTCRCAWTCTCRSHAREWYGTRLWETYKKNIKKCGSKRESQNMLLTKHEVWKHIHTKTALRWKHLIIMCLWSLMCDELLGLWHLPLAYFFSLVFTKKSGSMSPDPAPPTPPNPQF